MVSAALAGALLLGTTGCTFVAEIATLEEYDPSDGVGATIGDVQVRNMLAITEDGTRAALVFSGNNTGQDDVQLSVSLTEGGASAQRVSLPAGELTPVGSGTTQLVLEGLDVVPGSLLPDYVQYGSEPGRLLNVPVLDAALEEYAALLPSPTPTPTPAPTPTPTPTAPADPNATAEPGAPVEPEEPGGDEGAEQPPTDG